MMQERTNKLKELINKQESIRSISVIAHIDHGKTTMTDCLIKKAGISNKERYIDSVREDQIERIITIKSTGITLPFEIGDQTTPTKEKEEMLLSLVDTPGHAQFSDQTSAALRLTDGALLVVDCISGVAVQTETVLKQALEEKVTPVLLLNKLDRAFLELKRTPEELYQDLNNTLEKTNSLIRSFTPNGNEHVVLDPIKGNVAFGSGKQNWIFTLSQFAQFYSKETSVDKMKKHLWGDWFYDSVSRKWRNTPVFEGRKLERGFVRFVLKPLYKLCKLCMEPSDNYWSKIEKMISTFVPDLNKKESKNVKTASKMSCGKDLMQMVFKTVLPAAETILSMIYHHIPSPKEAQSKRATHLYTGPEDEVSQAIKTCDNEGPLTVFISKMVYHNKSFLAYGRVLSGTLREGHKVTILGDKYNASRLTPTDLWKDVIIKTIYLSLAKDFISVPSAVCGNVVCLGGNLEKYIENSATLTDFKVEPLYPIKPISFVVSPVVRVAVSPKINSDLPKLKEGLNILSKSSAMASVSFDESTKQFIIEGVGELHVEILLKDLSEFSKCELNVSKPVVPFRETVTELSQICLTKSANKLNRIYCTAEPLSSKLVEEIQNGKLNEIINDSKQLSKYLVEHHDWNVNDAKRIWCFGPEGNEKPCNVLVNQTKSAENLDDIKDHLISAFHTVCREGALCGEALIGVRFNIQEVKVHSDSSHRGASQIVPAAERLFRACQLMSVARLVEPVYLSTLRLPLEQLGNVYQFLGNKRTKFVSEEHENNQVELKVYLPVLESFQFDSQLGSQTSGKAFPSLTFSHWETIVSDPFVENSVSNSLVLQTRQRKGLKKEIPTGEILIDKL